MRITKILSLLSANMPERKEDLRNTKHPNRVRREVKGMTQTQVAYWNYREQTRHNKASEAEDERSHRANEAETNRHNVTTEVETSRHNKTTEYETGRHNLATERETERHNVTVENETFRSNVANEGIKRSQLAETVRSNQASEMIQMDRNAETKRSNLAHEAETFRSNQANEGIKQSELAEKVRHNKNDESIRRAADAETKRHNEKSEDIMKSDDFWNHIINLINGRSASEVVKNVLNNTQADPELTKLQKEKLEAEIKLVEKRTQALGNKGVQSVDPKEWWQRAIDIANKYNIPYRVMKRLFEQEE